MEQLLWQPSTERIAATNMAGFMRFVTEGTGQEFSDYKRLHSWSVTQPESFWRIFWQYSGVIAAKQPESVLSGKQTIRGAKWFDGARLNFAENLLAREDSQPALISWVEDKRCSVISYAELRKQVLSLASGLVNLGIKPHLSDDDKAMPPRIAGLLPNVPAAVISMLACSTIGAIWSSCSPDFGAAGVLDRFGQIAPRIFITTDAYKYGGKTIDIRPKLQEILSQLHSVEAVIIVASGLVPQEGLTSIAGKPVFKFEQIFGSNPASFVQLPFDHPLYIMYSSGTTGAPKCIVHGAGGTLIQHLKEHRLHTDIKPGAKLFYFTTCGWMMWNWLVSGLASGATLVLYDGSPFYPDPAVLWQIAEQESLAVFGTSAKYLAALEKTGFCPRQRLTLEHLQIILSTGSPLLPQSFDFVYQQIKQDIQLASISGGTDIISCFALGNPVLPVYRNEIQCLGLGMDVKIFDDAGRAVVGAAGELVCTTPFPSRPLYFWNDPDGLKYTDSYFNVYPNIWRHGDWAEITSNGGMIMYGRSDAVLNPGGVRIGTAELYRAVESIPEILEALAVGQMWDGDERIVLFVRLQAGKELDEHLRETVKKTIREQASPRHVPAKIISVQDIPRTMSGKIVELAVKNIIHNRPVKNADALANPEALKLFENMAELQS